MRFSDMPIRNPRQGSLARGQERPSEASDRRSAHTMVASDPPRTGNNETNGLYTHVPSLDDHLSTIDPLSTIVHDPNVI
jgi:hypothetical protein